MTDNLPEPADTAEVTTGLTRQQEEVRQWLEDAAPALSGVFVGAALLVGHSSWPARAHLVAHALRELVNRLPEAVSGVVDVRVQEDQQLERLCSLWEQHGLPSTMPIKETPGLTSGLTLPREVISAVADVVSGRRSGAENQRAKAARLLTIMAAGSAPAAYSVDTWVALGRDLQRWAHVSAEWPPSPTAAAREQAVRQRFAEVEAALLALARRTHRRMEVLDVVLDRANAT